MEEDGQDVKQIEPRKRRVMHHVIVLGFLPNRPQSLRCSPETRLFSILLDANDSHFEIGYQYLINLNPLSNGFRPFA